MCEHLVSTTSKGCPYNAIGDLDRQILPVQRFSSRKASSSTCSFGESRLQLVGLDPGSNSITWSHGFQGVRVSNISLEKTSLNSCSYSGIFALAFLCFWDASARCCEVVPVAWRCSSGQRFTYSRCSPPFRVSSGQRETTLESESSESKSSNSSSKSSG